MNKKHPKMDRYLVNINQPYEVTWVIDRMAQYAVKVTAAQIRAAVKTLGVGRQKVYKYLTENN